MDRCQGSQVHVRDPCLRKQVHRTTQNVPPVAAPTSAVTAIVASHRTIVPFERAPKAIATRTVKTELAPVADQRLSRSLW